MADSREVLREVVPGYMTIRCPGCRTAHSIKTAGEHSWSFNGNWTKPTFAPSLLVLSGHYANNNIIDCWCTFEQRYSEKSHFKCIRCHSFIVDGQMHFLSDCSHELAGQVVDLLPFED